jgi:predicted GNAT family acetyltransferase
MLEREEAAANLPLGILLRTTPDDELYEEKQRPFCALVEDAGGPLLLMMHTPPYNMILFGAKQDVGEQGRLQAASEAGIAFLLREAYAIPGVIGPRDVATGFADAWSLRTGGAWHVQMEQMIYRLDRVNEVPVSPGEMILAQEEHLDLLTGWLVAFAEAAHETWTPEAAREQAKDQIRAQWLYLWQDRQPVSMARKARPTPHGMVVTGVYTPPEFRRRGYATSCVASLSRLVLEQGYQYCALYTDLSNPTSNSIYQRIGYRPIRASIVIGFD